MIKHESRTNSMLKRMSGCHIYDCGKKALTPHMTVYKHINQQKAIMFCTFGGYKLKAKYILLNKIRQL